MEAVTVRERDPATFRSLGDLTFAALASLLGRSKNFPIESRSLTVPSLLLAKFASFPGDWSFSSAEPPAAESRIIRGTNFAVDCGTGIPARDPAITAWKAVPDQPLPAALFFPSSPRLEKRRHGGHRHDSWTIALRISYPTQWATWFFYPNLRMKFQLSLATGCGPPDHSRKKLRPRIGDIVRHSVGKITPWGRVVQLSPRNLASCC